jgi:AraC family transcriptional regulator
LEQVFFSLDEMMVTVHPTIVELQDIKVAGLRGQTTLRNNTLPQLWKQFMKTVENIPNRTLI